MPTARDAFGWFRLRQPARYAVFLGLFYAYVLWVLGPQFLLHDQSPAFFLRWAAFVGCAKPWPGGAVEYLAAGLSQVYAYPWLGALVLTLAVGVVCLLSEWLLNRMALACAARSESGALACASGSDGGALAGAWGAVRLLPFFPGVCLLVLLDRYTLPLSVLVALCAALLLACGYARLPWRRAWVRLVTVLTTCCVVYVIAGGVSVLLACLCGFIEILARRARLSGVVILAAGAAVPYVAGSYVYLIGLQDAYLRLTAFDYDFSPPLASIILYASVPLSLVVVSLRWRSRVPHASGVHKEPARPGPGERERTPSDHRDRRCRDGGAVDTHGANRRPVEGVWGWFLRTAVLVLVTALAAYGSFDADRRAVLAIDYHVRNRQWDKALNAARRLEWSGAVPGRQLDGKLARTCFLYRFPVGGATSVPLLPGYSTAIHDINFALAQRGVLLDEMFRYPQPMGVSVVRLVPDDTGVYVAHSFNTDVLLELGDVNEAERVACESLSNVGPRTWLLERLVVIDVLKGRSEAARTCLSVLAGDLRHRAWADAVRRELDGDPLLSGRADVQRLRARMLRKDHVGHVANMHPDEEMLRYLLAANPHNRMAFDYLMAHYLTTLQDGKVAGNVRYLKDFGYTSVPRHCQEAVLLHAKLAGHGPDLGGFRIGPETIQRFEAFQREVDELGGPGGPDNSKVRDALLTRYGDTYWFYALFGNSFFGGGHGPATSRPRGGS